MEQTIPKLFKSIAGKYPDRPAQYSKDSEGKFQPVSYAALYEEVKIFACGLLSLGVTRGDHIGLISENRKEWLVSDLAILSLGAADVPRGCDSTVNEIQYILDFSDCRIAIIENETQLKKVLSVKDKIPALKTIIMMEEADTQSGSSGREILPFKKIVEKGMDYLAKNPARFEEELSKGEQLDVATLIFTSGTTGEPKGVMLSHLAFLNQVYNVPKLIEVGPEDIWLCVLPVWHSFERIMQYVSIGSASALAYSKPVGTIMLADFAAIKPTWMASVPRIWSSIKQGVYRNVNSEGGIKKALFHFFVAVSSAHATLSYMLKGLLPRFKKRIRIVDIIVSIIPFLLLYPLRLLGNVLVFKKIKAKLGGRFTAGISGGGALPSAVDKFFAAAGILLLEGYGLTETAPVLGVRKQKHPVPGTVGPVFPGMEVKVVDENFNPLKPGHKGLILARGPQVMLGYYKKPEETKKIISEDGWFNTGDLGMLTWNNEIKIMGRAKDTIVLLGGENVEPAPIEEKLVESDYIDQAIVLGQDQKYLAALLVPNLEKIETFAKENNISYLGTDDLIETPEIIEIFSKEVLDLISPKNGFKVFERIFRLKLIAKPFEVGQELSQKQEIKRHVITEMYKKEIKELFRN
ncbi:MAG: AMP-binding protein [Spirochaetota bacterium]